MKKVLYLVFLTTVSFLLLTSCGNDEKTQQEKPVKVRKDELSTLIYTKQDSIVRSLKKMPEYKDVVFLSPKESKEYLDILIKSQKNFLVQKHRVRYLDEKKPDYLRESLRISIDTTQSARPLAQWECTFFYYQTDETIDVSSYNVEVFYLSKLQLVYLKVLRGGLPSRNFNLFDDSIRSEFNQLSNK